MKKHRLSRRLTAVLCAQLLLASCSATAHAPLPWPQPQPEPRPAPAGMLPDFHAPSAGHCARPVQTRELAGRELAQDRSAHLVDRADRADHPTAERRARAGALARGEPAAESRAMATPSAPPAPAFASSAPPALARQAPGDAYVQRPIAPRQHLPVTAGVVDDNADFDAYLAFRDRTQVAHRPRDVRERYLLEVKDPAGRPVGDAEVALQSPAGYAMWARTDAGGRAWLHPDAFDPERSPHYAVAVRKDGRAASAQLTRGQQSAVEVRLDAAPPPARARLDLVFLIDATGSMADEIGKLKATLRTITAEVAQLPSRPDICLGLVAYRDRGDAFLLRSHDFSNDVGAFLQQALQPLRADGGGDYPEAMAEALHETVHRLGWRGDGTTRMVILLADAPPHLDYGAPHYDDAMVAALGKGIKIFGVGASGLDRQGEFIQRQMAQYTGGRFVFLTYAQARHPGSGPGRETTHDVKNYSVDTLDRLIVRLVSEELAKGAS